MRAKAQTHRSGNYPHEERLRVKTFLTNTFTPIGFIR